MSCHRAAHREGIRLAAIGWQERLEQCETESEVIGAVRDYLATLTPEEIAELPTDFVPRRLVDGEDISTFAVQLLLGTSRGEAQCPLLRKLANVFSLAAVQLSKLAPAADAANQEGAKRQSA